MVAVATYLWFQDWRIGGVIAGAMIINLIVAALTGFAVPLTLKRMKIDPALAGGVVLTTITDAHPMRREFCAMNCWSAS